MSLLAPLFLLGALAVALPILFHLIRRTSREKVRFSSLMFLLPSPPRITRRSRLEHLLLLLLRCAVIGLLALAFARPFLRRPLLDPPPETSPARVILLVDTSASMRRENLWAEALERAETLLKDLSPSSELAVFGFDQAAAPVLTFEEWNRTPMGDRERLARERIATLQPTWRAGRLDTTLIQAAEELQAGEEKQPGPQQIVIISDFQEGSQLDRLQSYEWPRHVAVRLESVAPRTGGNAGVHFVGEREGSGALSSARRVRITNARDSNVEHFELRWAETVPESNAVVRAYVPAGQTRVFQAPPLPTNLVSSTLRLTGDTVQFDNRAYWAEPLPTEAVVLYFGNTTERDATAPLYYLKRAFEGTARQRITLLSQEAALRQLAGSEDTSGRPGPQPPAVLAIIASELDNAQARRLGGWIGAGKTALLILSKPAMATTLAQLTDSGPVAVEESKRETYSMLGQIDFEHPVFTPFADPRYSDFTKIHFWKHRRIQAEAFPQSRVLAQFDDESPALFELPVGKGRLLVLTSGWDPSESQLALSSKFVPLLYSLLEYSGAPRPGTAQFLVGDAVPLPAITTAQDDALSVRKPDGGIMERQPGQAFIYTEAPGIYNVLSQQRTQQFAVNLAASESRTAPLPPEELQRLGVPLQNKFKPSPERLEQKRRELHFAELEDRQKLWRWLIIAVLVILVIETWFAARLTRRVSMPEMQV